MNSKLNLNKDSFKNLLKESLPLTISIIAFIIFASILYYNKTPSYNYEEGRFDVYPYQYAQVEEGKINVLLIKNPLPVDDKLIFSVSRDVIKRVYNEDISDSFTVIKRSWTIQIRFDSPKTKFLVTAHKNEGKIDYIKIEPNLS